MRRIVPIALVIALCFSLSAVAFAPAHHLSLTLGALEGSGFSYGQVWMVAYFNIEIDLATEVPEWVCNWILRWPTEDYVCPNVGRLYGPGFDPCAGAWPYDAYFDSWAEHCVPFHCPGVRPAEGLDEIIAEWRLLPMHDAMHYTPGERCYDWLRRAGHMLHVLQDFYAHSNWVEVFHLDLGFAFDRIPSWTSFQLSQRGEKLNLILLSHANGDAVEAKRLYDLLDKKVHVKTHATFNKDSDDADASCYDDGSRDYHNDSHGHTILDFHRAAVAVAGADTYQVGLMMRNNIVNNPQLGPAVWSNLFRCVEEMAAYDGMSYDDELSIYRDGIARLCTYGGILSLWH